MVLMRSLERLTKGRFSISVLAPALLLCASQPWNRDYTTWTAGDARRVLEASPWAQQAEASFEKADSPDPVPPGPLPGAPEAGMAGPRGVSDGRWDGGIGRNPRGGTPSLSVLVRWDSALPVRQALSRTHSEENYTPEQFEKDYIITIVGLVPGGRYRAAGHLQTKSESGDTSSDPQDPEQMLEGLMGASRLAPRGKAAIAPENVKLDSATGAIHLFFPRSVPIDASDKEVLFATRFGSMTIDKRFRLKDLQYMGRLDL